MACHNQSFSLLGKRKKKEYGVNLEPEEVITTCKSSSTANTEKTLNIEEEEEKDECITTPKSEKHKISAIKCCPPAPLKPRSTARKRKTLMSQGAVYIPCDFPYMDLLFDSDPKSKQSKSRKVEKILQAI